MQGDLLVVENMGMEFFCYHRPGDFEANRDGAG